MRIGLGKGRIIDLSTNVRFLMSIRLELNSKIITARGIVLWFGLRKYT